VNLANTLSSLGEHTKAKELYLKVLVKKKKLFGEDHSTVALTEGNLANTLSSLGEHTKAKELYLKVLEKDKKLFGEDHSCSAPN
jgi:tetratricopeptide (TPR) repeat protein